MSIIGFFLALFLGLGAATGGTTPPSSAPADGAPEPRATIKQVVNAVESCAASRIDSTYTGAIPQQPDVDDCLDPKTIQSYESSLADLELATTPPAPGSGAYQLAPIGSEGAGYLVQVGVEGGYFAELHRPDGMLLKLCGPAPFSASATAPTSGVRDLEGCSDDGTW